MKVLPPDVLDSVLIILSYAATTALGWIAKILQRKSKEKQELKKSENDRI